MTTQIGKFEPINLFAGEMYRSTKPVTLSAGKIYPVGSVLAMNSAGDYVLVDSSQTDPEDKPDSVLAEEVDATDSAMVSVAYTTGEFNRNMLSFGGSDTWETHANAARIIGLFFLDTSVFPE